ncbi:hypothetical protein [Paenibacillus mucilaginosus]|uniref:Uncharacterized protein n=1 Tax=Paenibacillus mucilaginosus (strain KNP414) TaxID=1036673 RepID=F8F9R6_PAEMK|nr:hypothetical protein [Paenibacillus mucilaginosus]AEI44395.1 hypothetical protein KNP414_05871 [Paenibacillus mucilaginosus KNP414]MCG7213775.1 hypothetical protein [Paenibacillus mucilaginosus]WDM25787.1 hypothetical protein KCX80_25530 [Paenibacillus mucilaginosus]
MSRFLTERAPALLVVLIALIISASLPPQQSLTMPQRDYLENYGVIVPDVLPVKQPVPKWRAVPDTPPLPYREGRERSAQKALPVLLLLFFRCDVRKRLRARVLSPLKFTSIYVVPCRRPFGVNG